MSEILFWPLGPRMAEVTDYDYRHLATYVRLLEAEAKGAGEPEMARTFLALDPALTPRMAGLAARSHLNRAHWLMKNKFLPLMWCVED